MSSKTPQRHSIAEYDRITAAILAGTAGLPLLYLHLGRPTISATTILAGVSVWVLLILVLTVLLYVIEVAADGDAE